jgi:TPP-dependent pyruvate/acetoin dehydrogenase alpha subunit
MKKVMLSHKILTKGQINDIEKRAKETVDDAAAFAQHSPFPSEETVRNGVYA